MTECIQTFALWGRCHKCNEPTRDGEKAHIVGLNAYHPEHCPSCHPTESSPTFEEATFLVQEKLFP